MNYELFELEDIPDDYRCFAEVIGVAKFVEAVDNNTHLGGKLPSIKIIVANMKRRRIKEEYNGYNNRELCIKYGYNPKTIYNIVRSIYNR